MFYKSRKNRLRSPTGTQSILLFEEKAFWYLQGSTILQLSVRKITPFPSITAENQTLRSKKQGEQRFNYAFYTFTHSDSKPKIFRTSYSADTNVLEQENAWERWPKMGLQVKERRDKRCRWRSLACLRLSVGCSPSLATFESWGRRKSVRPGLERWQIG